MSGFLLSSRNYATSGTYPVLAPVSRRYPDLLGRLSTRYSPVRHYSVVGRQAAVVSFFGLPSRSMTWNSCFLTNVRRLTTSDQTVRLACVKHAASVRPEPGSNSPYKIYEKLSLALTYFFISSRIRTSNFEPRTSNLEPREEVWLNFVSISTV